MISSDIDETRAYIKEITAKGYAHHFRVRTIKTQEEIRRDKYWDRSFTYLFLLLMSLLLLITIITHPKDVMMFLNELYKELEWLFP